MTAAGVAFVLLGYLSGSIPFGLVIAQLWAGRDVRSMGSGNIGATNVARVVGKWVGLLVLVLDAAKGVVPVLVVVERLPSMPQVQAMVGLAAVLGHVFPLWLRFRGGKGVATSLGVLTVLLPYAAVAGAALFIVVFVVSRVSSISSLAAAVAAVVATWFLRPPMPYAALALTLLLLLLFTHRGNLGRLWRSEERRF